VTLLRRLRAFFVASQASLARLARLARLVCLVSLASLIVACSGVLPTALEPTPAASEAVQPTEPATPDVSLAATPSPTVPSPQVLRIWLPPEFDPEAGTPAGDILKARLEEFTRRRAGMRIEVRVKAVEGPGGLLDALSSASAAAPLVLPDVVALPRPILEAAALKGLLHPYDDLTQVLEQADWYDYARQLSRIQTSAYGLPFAGDARVLVYRAEALAAAPKDWAGILELTEPLIFPAASSSALFTLGQYQGAGGIVQDEQGRPLLELGALEGVLAFYRLANEGGSMPFWLTQFETDEQAWEAYLGNQSNLVETSLWQYLEADDPASRVGLLFTQAGEPFSLATGWVWALASARNDRLDEGAALADYLVEPAFLARWSEAAGFLPPRRNALAAWDDAALAAILEEVALSSQLEPATDLMLQIGPVLQSATLQILKDQIAPHAAAQAAVDSLSTP